MPSPLPDEHPLPVERLVSRLDLQPWLARRLGTPNRQLGLSTPFLRGLGLPAVLHLPAMFVIGLLQTVAGSAWAHDLFTAVVYVAFPVAEAVGCLVLAGCIHQRRSAGTLTAAVRAQSRLLGYLLAVLSGFGLAAGLWEPLAVSALAVLAMLVPAHATEPADGRPWWAA